jgi:hypothetical protein
MVAGLEYHPDFVSPPECAQLLDAIAAMPLVEAQYKQFTARRRVLHVMVAAGVRSPRTIRTLDPPRNRLCRRGYPPDR